LVRSGLILINQAMNTVSAEPVIAAMPHVNPTAVPFWKRAAAIGTGFGIAIGDRHLEAAIVRARPGGASPIATTASRDFRSRPAAEWGAELQKFVNGAGESRLAAVVLLPRSEVVVRTLSLPGVADRDVANAVELQIDTLHPWGDVKGADTGVVWGWARAGSDILIGLARQETLASYETLFAEAGIPLAAVTFSPAVIHAALRVWSAPPRSVLCLDTDDNGRTEVYGESESRSVFSAEFPGAPARAAALARAELRIPADHAATLLAEQLPGNPRGNAFAHAAAIAGSVPRIARIANFLPAERRASNDRVQYLIPAVLGAIVVLALIAAFVVVPAVEQRRYREDLDRATRQLEPAASRARALERTIAQNSGRIQLLDEIRRRPQADLQVLNELTRILPATVWTNSIEIHPDSVMIAGEADQAAPLLKLLDSSPLFQNSEFVLSFTRTGETEQFRIKTIRRGRVGRQTP
jgi:hypothetical protein